MSAVLSCRGAGPGCKARCDWLYCKTRPVRVYTRQVEVYNVRGDTRSDLDLVNHLDYLVDPRDAASCLQTPRRAPRRRHSVLTPGDRRALRDAVVTSRVVVVRLWDRRRGQRTDRGTDRADTGLETFTYLCSPSPGPDRRLTRRL